MTDYNHTPIAVGAPADAATINNPLGELDDTMGDVATLTTDSPRLTGAINELHALISVVNDEEASQRTLADNELDDRIDNIIAQSGTSDTEVVDARTAIRYAIGNAPTTLSEALEYAAQNVYNVLAYGAVSDGTTDDSGAILAAIAAADAAGGGKVFLPEGHYLIDNIVGCANVDNVIVEGQGDGTVIIFNCPVETDSWFIFSTCTHIVVRDLKLRHTNTSVTVQAYAGVQFYHCEHCRVEGVTVIAHRSATVTQGSEGLRFMALAGVTFSDSIHCTVINSHFEYCRVAVRFEVLAAGENTNSCTAINCTSDTCARFFQITDPVGYSATTPPDNEWANAGVHHNTIAYCRAVNCVQAFGKVDPGAFFSNFIGNHIVGGGTEVTGNGMLDFSSGYSTAIGNYFDVPAVAHLGLIYTFGDAWHCNIDGNTFAPSTGENAIYLGNLSSHVRIANNMIRGDDSGQGIGGGSNFSDITILGNNITNTTTAINIGSSDNINIVANNITGCGSRGIHCNGGENVTISGNKIRYTALNGILVDNSAKHVSICNNVVTHTNSVGTAANDDNKAHIFLASSVAGATIMGNTCRTIGATIGTDSIRCTTAANVAVVGNVTQYLVTGTGTNFTAANNVVQA